MPLARRTDLGDSNYAGLEVEACHDLQRSLADTLDGGFDFLVAPLAHPRHRRPAPSARDPNAPQPAPFARSDLLLNSSQWSSQVVGKTSPWIDCDSASPPSRRDGEAALRQELMWAAHLSLHAVLLPHPGFSSANYARVVNQFLGALFSTALWVRVPVVAPEVEAAAKRGEPEPSSGTHFRDPFEHWANFRALCEGHLQLGVCLDVGCALPSDREIDRWIGEPVRALSLAPEAFITNKRGFPVLPKRHQDFVTRMMKRNVQVVLKGAGDTSGEEEGDVRDEMDTATTSSTQEPTPAEASIAINSLNAELSAAINKHPSRQRWEYVVYLFRKIAPTTEQELQEAGYRDYLQAPLQPLMDNLESATYETFEKDASKYIQYEEAVLAYLTDRVSDVDAKNGKETVLMVVGAGRGPLVRASLRASDRSGRKLKVYAVEKNPNAVITLQSLVETEGWGDRVTIVNNDMRVWNFSEKADVLVSELLGSFGDNELSPECLDGAQRFLKDDGVSIPQSYTSYLAPITAAKLWNDAKSRGDLKHMETPYVVKLHRHSLVAEPQEVFKFEHPNCDAVIDNTRYVKLIFSRGSDTKAATVHGFAGYFDAVLYHGPAGTVNCSIYPPTHTIGPQGENMFSWFPIYFPIRTPVDVPCGKDIEAHMWRCVGNSKVWYEWAVTKPTVGPVHNVNGRSYWVGL
ncbi:protein arginine N-methyltransferase [bacterium]|nr:protein arginine N-methyltransferase [bacterium]|tara:strand:- start:1725 stop:3785 length:2061 start_codon:yes stop_codon:yes gene_type:complete